MRTLLFFALLLLVYGAPVNYGNYDNTIPSYTYPIYMNVGDVLNATLSWPNTQDLDIYLYKEGMDLLSRATYLAREYSGSLNPEVMIYTCTSAGLYYVRADLYSATPTAYSFNIQINSTTEGMYYDTVLSYTTARTVQQFSTQNACKVTITYTGRVCPLYLFAPGVNVVSGTPYASDTTSNNPKVITVTLSTGGNWNLVVNHGITSGSTTPESFNVDIKTYT